MLNLITKLAIYDPDTHEHVILTNIMEGVDGSASFGWSEEVESIMIEDGQTYEHTLNGTLDIKVMRGSDAELAIIDGVVGKRAIISAITINGFLAFSGAVYINRVPDFNSAILNDHIRFTAKRQKGYIPSTQSQGFYGGENALMLYDILNGYPEDDDTVLGGFERVITTADYSVSNGVQSILTTGAGNGSMQLKGAIFHPFEEPFTFSGYNLDTLIQDVNFFVEMTDDGVLNSDGSFDRSNTNVSTFSSGSSAIGRISATLDRAATGASTKRFFKPRITSTPGDQQTINVEKLAVKLGTNDQFSY